MTEREIAQIDDPNAPNLSERERCALAFCETLILLPTAMTDERFASVREHFSEGEIVEMSFFVGFYNLLHRFNAVIDLDPKNGDEIVVESLSGFQLASDDREGTED